MMVDFHKCVEELDKYKDIKVVVLSAVGEHFCSGGDLDFAKQNDNPEAGFYMSWWMQDVLIRYRKLPLVCSILTFINQLPQQQIFDRHLFRYP